MTHLKWYNSTTKTAGCAAKVTRRIRSSGKPATAVAGLLMVTALLLSASGCSKAKNRNVTTSGQNPQNVSSQAVVSPVQSATSTAPAIPAIKPKKPVKRLPSTVTYSDSAYGFSFQYPRKYVLKTGDKARLDSAPMDFAGPGGVTVATVELPGSSYIGTDLYSASFNVSVNKGLTAEQCEQFVMPEHSGTQSADGVISPAKVSINGTEFEELEEAAEQIDTKYYHLFVPELPASANGVQDSTAGTGACYEFALNLQKAETEPEDKVTPVNRDEIFTKLEKILATVKIKSENTAQQIIAGDGSH